MSEANPFGPIQFTDQTGTEICYRRLAPGHWQSRAPCVPVWRDENDIPDAVRKLAEEHDEWVRREQTSSQSKDSDVPAEFAKPLGPTSAGGHGMTAWLAALGGWLLGL